MATVNSTTNSGSDVFAALGASTKKSGGSQADQIQDRFLTLLVTQLKNQDPLSPMDNSQITTQLSQISTVYGSLTTAIAVLLSLELASTLLLLGAQVIAEYERLGTVRKDAGAPSGADSAMRAMKLG